MADFCGSGCGPSKKEVRYRKIGFIAIGRPAIIDPVDGEGAKITKTYGDVIRYTANKDGFTFETHNCIYRPIVGGAIMYWRAKRIWEDMMDRPPTDIAGDDEEAEAEIQMLEHSAAIKSEGA